MFICLIHFFIQIFLSFLFICRTDFMYEVVSMKVLFLLASVEHTLGGWLRLVQVTAPLPSVIY